MARVDRDGDAPAGHVVSDARNERVCEFLLRCHALGKGVHEARGFAETKHARLRGDVGDVCLAVEGEERVAARRGEGDVAHENEAAAALGHHVLLEHCRLDDTAAAPGSMGFLMVFF